MISKLTLRQLFLAIISTVVVVPMVIVALYVIPAFRSAIDADANSSLQTHASVAEQRLAERQRTRLLQMDALLSSTFSTTDSRITKDLGQQLSQQAELLQVQSLLWLDTKGIVRASSTGGSYGHTLDWPVLGKLAQSGDATSVIAIVPPTEMYALGLSNAYKVDLKKAAGGSASPDEVAGVLAIVTLAPVRTSPVGAGTVVAIDALKLDNGFVDQVVGQIGGQATIFQNGVRVATTVRDAAGDRAIGTPVSDPVRKKTLEGGQKFEGSALVVGKQYYASYDPLVDPDGKVVGMLFVGIPKGAYDAMRTKFTLTFLAIALAGLGLSLGLGYGASGTVARPLARVGAAAGEIAAGDLTVDVPEEGYKEAAGMGHAFNAMTHTLREILARVGESAGTLDTVATEIADASRGEADSASSQASAVAEATATIEEITRSFAAVADGARRVLDIAEDSLEEAQQGRSTIQESATSVDILASGTVAVGQAADHLADVAEDIDQVTFVIGSIAEQTKILALNAAIEAARAGEAGKGFGVVATEIRGLADSVATSVGRITTLVNGIQTASKVLSDTANQQGEVATNTVIAGAKTRESFDDILTQMERTAAAAREIASAAAQQQAASKQIVEVMQQVSSGVTKTATASRGLAESAGDVKQEAEILHRGLGRFRT